MFKVADFFNSTSWSSMYIRQEIVFLDAQRRAYTDTHYREKAGKAGDIAGTVFTVKRSYFGDMPPWFGRKLYMARVDPHLTAGCEVMPDVRKDLLDPLKAVQISFLSRLLGVSSSRFNAPLFTETGLLPVDFRRVVLTLRYLIYLLELDDDHLAACALRDSRALHEGGYSSWVSDLQTVLRSWLGPGSVDVTALQSRDMVVDVIEELQRCASRSLSDQVSSSPLTAHLRNRKERDYKGRIRNCPALGFRHYLKVAVRDHRVSLTRLLLGQSNLNVDLGRQWGVEHNARICRFCMAEVEDGPHVLFACTANEELNTIRGEFERSLSENFPVVFASYIQLPASLRMGYLFIRRLGQLTLGLYLYITL